MRILVTGGGGAASEALRRLWQDPHDVHFADADVRVRPAGVPPEAWHQIPLAASPDFVPVLSQRLADLGVDLLVPGVDEELEIVAAHRSDLPARVLVPDLGFVATHLDKLASHRALFDVGLPTPSTSVYDDAGAFPCVVKPRRGRGSRDVRLVRSLEEARAHLLLSGRPASDFLMQTALVGQEYTVTMVADQSRTLRAVVPARVDLKRGITIRAATEANDVVTGACAAMHAAMPTSGVYNIQLMLTPEGGVMPFEINPRISTTTCLAMASGVDVLALALATDAAPPVLVPFRAGTALRRSWRNVFVDPDGQEHG